MSKVDRKLIVEASKLRNIAIEEAREALAESLKPVMSAFSVYENDDDEDEEELDFELEPGEDEDEEALEEIRTVVKTYLKEKEENLDDDDLEPDEIFSDEDDEDYAEKLDDIGERYGIDGDTLKEIVSREMMEMLEEEYNYPAFALLRENGGYYNGVKVIGKNEIDDTDDEEIDLDELIETSATGDISGPAGYNAFADTEDEDEDEEDLEENFGLRERTNKLLENEDEDELELIDDEDEELELEMEYPDDEEPEDEDEIDVDMDADSLEMIGSEYEDEYDTEEEDEDDELIKGSRIAMKPKKRPSENEMYEAAIEMKASMRDFKKAPFEDMRSVSSRTSVIKTGKLLTEEQEKSKKKLQEVMEKHGKKRVAVKAVNQIADRLRKQAGIKIYDDLDLATGKTKAQLMVENLDNKIVGTKMKKDSDKDLIVEN